MVMDARTGAIYAQNNADERLHPASLTKMMTLYIAFEAVERGEIDMDAPIRISANAASEIPSKLGLKQGQTIALRYLVRGAAVKSANDAATAIAEGISGSESAFVDRMNRTARALGMTRTHFENAHGLTEPEHLSTARDMTLLGLRLLRDYPEYFNLFSRLTADAGITEVRHTNRQFLTGYPGADGIKTGYTRAAGYNLVASATRGPERIITTVMGASSTSERNDIVSRLMDRGFASAPTNATYAQLPPPNYTGAVASSPFPPERPESIDHQARLAESQDAFSYAEMMARRRAAQGFTDPAAPTPVRPTPRVGHFRAVIIPRPGTGRFVASSGPTPGEGEILAAATATISELRQMAGYPAQGVRGAGAPDEDVQQAPRIDRVEMSDFERGIAHGAEIPMAGGPTAAGTSATPTSSTGAARNPFAPNPIGTFRPVRIPAAGAPLAPVPQARREAPEPARPEAAAIPDMSIFNIDRLAQQEASLPENSIFRRTPIDMLPDGLMAPETAAPGVASSPSLSEVVPTEPSPVDTAQPEAQPEARPEAQPETQPAEPLEAHLEAPVADAPRNKPDIIELPW